MEDRAVVETQKLVEGEAHLWWIPLTASARAIELHRQVLPPDESGRAGRFYFEEHRLKFIIAHGALRRILSGYVRLPPRELKFTYGPKGKPEFSALQNPDRVRFNLSHSGDLALLAVARNQELGADVEFIKPDFGGMEIAERFFSASEVRTLFALDATERNAAFFSCWTRKEAFIKAVGEGLSLPLDSFDVTFAPGVKPELTRVEGSPSETSRWRMYDIPADPQYKAALVIEGREHRLSYWQWTAAQNRVIG
jgi:4'-phosphopantetheinyl transferase